MTRDATEHREPVTDMVAGSWWRWLGTAFAVAWLVFMVKPIRDCLDLGTSRGDGGAAVLVVFSISYVAAAVYMREALRMDRPDLVARARRVLSRTLIVMSVLAALAILLVGEPGIGALPYLAVVGSIAFGGTGGIWVAIVAAVAVLLARSHGVAWGDTGSHATGTLSGGLSVWVFSLLTQRQRARVRAAEAESELALESQRGRFARDLHDIVGHSLSVVTMKASLARRLLDVDPDAARRELEDLERLSRDALDDVRRAVGGYREISLPGELARAREILSAAEIRADVPTAAEEVDPGLRELFAWAVREGVTNTVRHSRASHCSIRLDAHRLVIEDDGPGPAKGGQSVGGHGLLGLTERAVAAGAQVLSETIDPHGFRLTVRAREDT